MNTQEDKIKEKLFLDGIKAFESHEFYDAHEYWEDLWSDYKLKDPKFVQALIQLSVGYFHISNLNINGARGLLNKCVPKFELYRPVYKNLDINFILGAISKSLDNLEEIDDIKNFNWELVPLLDVDYDR